MNNIVVFDFGQASKESAQKDTNMREGRLRDGITSSEKPGDELILVDAYWEKRGLKIRFIPHQMKQVLKVVFRFKYDDDKHDKDKASFDLNFVIPGTIYQQQKKWTIQGSSIKTRPLKEKNKPVKKDGKICYYCEIENFSSDLVNAIFKG